MEKVKHTVLMVSYNQEEYLPLALDSLFSQSELPYEVVISDDCSTDGTWNVIMEYYNKYPAIVKPIRNKRNLGVFGNINQVKKLPTGDIISWLSGDDLYKPGIFETFNEVVSGDNEKVCTLVNQQSEIVILIVAPLAILVILTAPILIKILLSDQFLSLVPVIRWMGIGVFFKAIAFPMGYISFSKGDKKFFSGLREYVVIC